jgi:pilus assembly protein Flp/PilA
MKNRISNLINDTRGGTFVEYIILTGLVALFCIAGYRAFGTSVSTKVQQQATQVTGIR